MDGRGNVYVNGGCDFEPADARHTPSSTTVPEAPAGTPRAAVQEFVQVIGGDSEAAFAMLTNESREILGSPAQLVGCAQEFGPWTSPGAIEQESVMIARSPAGMRVAVVTYTGTFGIQGAPQPRTQAFACSVRRAVAFDGGEALNPSQLELSDLIVTAHPGLEAGPHVVTIAIVLRDGVFFARAVQFVVE